MASTGHRYTSSGLEADRHASTSARGATMHAITTFLDTPATFRRRDARRPSASEYDRHTAATPGRDTTPTERSSRQHVVVDTVLRLPLESYALLAASDATALACAILGDLTSEDCDWESSARLGALKVLKEMSRLPGPSIALSIADKLEQLHTLIRQGETDFEKSDVDLEQLDLTLRILNNVLFQHEHARLIFASTGGIKIALSLIARPGTPTLVFLSARLVFFATMSPNNALKDAVQNMQLVETFSARLGALLQAEQSSDVEFAMSELLKAFFNVSLHYPALSKGGRAIGAVIGEDFDEALLPFLAPTMGVMTDMQQHSDAVLQPPWSNAVAVLLNYPVAPYEQVWLNGTLSGDVLSLASGSRGERRRQASSSSACEQSDRSSVTSAMSRSRKMAATLLRQSLHSPFGSRQSGGSSESSSTRSSTTARDPLIAVALVSMLDTYCMRYFAAANSVDDDAVNRLARQDEFDLEAAGEPAFLLLRKLAAESETFRVWFKARILPASIDRSVGLDERTDMIGVMVRLMASSSYSRLARASGEALLAMCGGDAHQMTMEIGYGPCAGFLMSIGQSHILPSGGVEAPTSKTDAHGRPVDQITGKVLPTEEEIAQQDAESGLSAMTMEEKEAEAERLFCLFDRLDRTGIMKVDRASNPIHRAVDSGRIQEIEQANEEEERAKLEREDEEEAAQVEKDMRSFKARKARRASGSALS